MKKTRILLLLASSLFSCYNPKEPQPDKVHLTGRVLAYGTNEPVAGATVWASDCVGGEILGAPCRDRIVDTDTTDAQGRYELDATGFALDVGANKANYDSRNTRKPVNGSGERVIDIVIWPNAWLNITLTNKSGLPYVSYATTSNHNVIIPKDSSYTYSYEVLGNYQEKIYIKVSDVFGKYKEIYDTIYCPGLDTTFHRIAY